MWSWNLELYSSSNCQDEWATVLATSNYFRQKLEGHVELLQAVKFGTNQNFEWALPEDETKTPDLKSVETMIRLSRLRYTGHVMRMDNNRLPKIILHGEINMGKRKVGRPKQNFRSCIKEHLQQLLWLSSTLSNYQQSWNLAQTHKQRRRTIPKGMGKKKSRK